MLERKGAKIGLIASEGFRDVLEIGYQLRQDLHRIMLEPVTPVFLAPGAQRKEAREQVSAQGEVIVPLDEASVRQAAAELVADGVQAIAVCYLFSFLHPEHEQRTRELIEAAHPGIAVSLSSEVDPTFREYERTVVTAFDAYMKPVVGRYLERLEDGLRAARGDGAVADHAVARWTRRHTVARKRPVRLFLSGPAAGVIGGAIVGRSSGHRDLITIDVGGTSSDIALVEGGEPVIRAQGNIAGFPVRVPMVDVNAIGAGGGRSPGSTAPAVCASARIPQAPNLVPPATAAAARKRPSPMHRSCSAGSIPLISPAAPCRSIRRWRARRSNGASRGRSAFRWRMRRLASIAW